MQGVIDQLKAELHSKKNQLVGLNQEVEKAQAAVPLAEARRDRVIMQVAELSLAIAKLEEVE